MRNVLEKSRRENQNAYLCSITVFEIRAIYETWKNKVELGRPQITMTPVQPDPGVHPASYTMGTGSYPGVKRPGRGVDHLPHLAQRL